MLIGLGGKKTAASSMTENTAFSFDVGMADFQAKVVAASMETPVLVDFWAPWCGPCKQLGPVLEKLVAEAGGKILLAKVNIDDNQQLAQALRVQSVPTVFAFFQGQPVTAFAGARPASELKTLFEQLIQMAQQARPDAIDLPAVLTEANAMLSAGSIAEAQNLFALVLEHDPLNAPAYAGLVRSMLASDEVLEARAMIDEAPESMVKDPAILAARTAVELAEARPDDSVVAGLKSRLAADPDNLQLRFDLGVARFAAGERQEAVNDMLEIIRIDRSWQDDKARLQLLDFFQAMGPADPLTMTARRKLSSMLFS